MKKTLAYFLLLPWLIRAAFLTAYRESIKQKKFVWKKQPPTFFMTEAETIGMAMKKARLTGITWHVIEPEPGKFVAVSDRYIQNHRVKKIYSTVV